MFRNLKSRLPIVTVCLLLSFLAAVSAQQGTPSKTEPAPGADQRAAEQKSEAKPTPSPTATPSKSGRGGLPSIPESITDQKSIRMETDLVSLSVTVIDPYN